jgi:alpha-mannosidase II
VLEASVRAAEIAYSLAAGVTNNKAVTSLRAEAMVKMVKNRRALALFQHHDGITGTAKTKVMQDYGTRMVQAVTTSQLIVAQMHGSFFPTEIYTRGCHWIPRMFA